MSAGTKLDLGISERHWQGYVVSVARLHRWIVYHTFDSRRSEPGFPDLVLVRGDRLIFAELKTERGKVTATQQVWLEALGQVPGITVVVWRPSDDDEVLSVLK